jgi:hypothetical protein
LLLYYEIKFLIYLFLEARIFLIFCFFKEAFAQIFIIFDLSVLVMNSLIKSHVFQNYIRDEDAKADRRKILIMA